MTSENVEIIEKKCSACRKIKRLDEFHKDVTRKSGLDRMCKKCKNKARRERTKKKSKERLKKKEIDNEKRKNATEKICRVCNKLKDMKLFGNQKSYIDGKETMCKECMLEYNKKRRIEKKSKEKIVVKEKKCTTCNKIKDIDHFCKSSTNIDGHESSCKDCGKKRRKRFYESLSEEEKNIKRERSNKLRIERLKDPEILAKEKEKDRQYYIDNKKRIDARQKVYIEENKEVVLERQRDYYVKNKQKLKEVKAEYYINNKDKISDRVRKNRQSDMSKGRAHIAVTRAVNAGKIIKPKECFICGKDKVLNAHHYNGYEGDNKLGVVFICIKCHRREHSEYFENRVDINGNLTENNNGQ